MRNSILITLVLLFQFVQAQQVSWNVQLIGSWNDSNIPFNGLNNTYNEVWGFSWGKGEYAVIGSREGVYIIDVTVPEYPNLLKFVKGAADDVTNRDFHDYNGYLYLVADQGPSSLQIVDLHYLPDSVSIIYDSDELFDRCHNIFIDSLASRLYACSVKKQDSTSDLQIYSLETPTKPELLLDYDAISAFHDIYVYNDTAFGHNQFEGMFVYDFTDLTAPSVISGLTDYPDKGYNHSGWTSEDRSYYYFADETHGSDIKVCDIRDIEDIEVVNTFNSGIDEEAMAHNLLVKGDLLYISYYHDGLQLFDISDPAKPVKAGFYDTYLEPDHIGGKGAWGVYPFLPSGNVLLSDREKGLFVFDVQPAIDYINRPDTVSVALLDIFPNPFTTGIQISTLEGQTITSMRVYNMQGQELMSSFPSETTSVYQWSEVENLAPGVYFIVLKGDNLAITKKLVKSF